MYGSGLDPIAPAKAEEAAVKGLAFKDAIGSVANLAIPSPKVDAAAGAGTGVGVGVGINGEVEAAGRPEIPAPPKFPVSGSA
jgi:hypothetical protein